MNCKKILKSLKVFESFTELLIRISWPMTLTDENSGPEFEGSMRHFLIIQYLLIVARFETTNFDKSASSCQQA